MTSPNAPTYTITTVADFLLVPEDRIGECLREFGLMLEMARAMKRLTESIADEMAKESGATHSPGDIRFQLVPYFEWIDDGLGTATVRIITDPDESPATGAVENAGGPR